MVDVSCLVSHLVELRQRRREHHEEKYKSTAVNVLCEKKGIPTYIMLLFRIQVY